ncbi:APC family permease [Canibacter zhoujuaniae]|uniref:APC family permease n=1 Tax=Canibacter zhoujuaniae TaxID=2708343 RepID=UPI00141FD935|nr:APC family permease [Canibacter zhoujuaniae]
MTDSTTVAALSNAHDEHSEQGFKREMGFWGNLALGFTYLSPVVGVYTTIGLALAIAGPISFWTLVVAGLGQLLVALVFGEIVSQYPIAGGIYPWNRRLWGAKWGWMSGWVYAVAINATIASVAFGVGPFLGAFLGIETNPGTNVILALVVIAFSTLMNFGGTRLLSVVAFIGFSLEIIATIVIGIWLLVAARQHDLSVFFTDFRPLDVQENEPLFVAFAFSAILGIFLYYGFEANGDVAEEVKDPGRVIPKAMRTTLYVGGVASMFIGMGLILAIPDYAAVIRGENTDPVTGIFQTTFGPIGFKIVLLLIMISYVSCTISLQAAASRLLFSMGRDKQLPGWSALRKFSVKRAVPPYALLVAGILPALIVVVSLFSADALIAVISFASLGIYLAFFSAVLASFRARLKGWQPKGPFKMGRWGWPVTIAAGLYQIAAMIMLVWPVEDAENWFQRYLVSAVGVIVLVIGVIYLFTTRPDKRGGGPAGDAHTGVVNMHYASPIAPSEEIVDMAVLLSGGKPHYYPHAPQNESSSDSSAKNSQNTEGEK